MKIINEIEKSRLNEENMHQINGGDNSCNPYLSCQPKYTVTPCALYNHCPEVIMKKILIFLLFISCSQIGICQSNVKVDERFELTSIVFRLTDIDVFAYPVPQNYVNDINEYFDKYKNHDLVKFVKNIIGTKQPFEISFIATSAAEIEITDNKLSFSKKLITCYDTAPAKDTTGSVWTKAELEEYLRLLNKFYKDTKFHRFFLQHSDFYNKAEERMQELVNQIDTAWFTSFFGQPYQLDNVWVVPSNGFNNFSVTCKDKTGKTYFNCALGCGNTDSLNYPIFDWGSLEVLIHEICHNYVNPICDKYWSVFEPACDSIFAYVSEPLTTSLYGSPEALFYESTNRLCEFTYLNTHPVLTAKQMKRNLIINHLTGLIWMRDLIDFLEIFAEKKGQYPHFEDIMPQLLGFMQQIPQNMENYYLPQFELMRPCVRYTYPSKNSMVDTDLDTIIISFSQPMQQFFVWGNFADDDNAEVPPLKEDEFWIDDHTVAFPVDGPLKPHTTYGIPVSIYTTSASYIPVKEFVLIFKTK